jgi:iron complex outermembrane receptor protein
LSYDLGDVELKSISAYREVLSDFARDSLSSPFLAADTVDNYDQKQFSQEFQLLGNLADGKVDYVLGAYYLNEDGTNSNLVDTSIGGLQSGGSVDNESYAFFGQTNFNLTDDFGVTAGIRYTDETKRFDPGFRGGEQEFIVNANGATIGLPPAGTAIPLIVAPESLGLGSFYVNADDSVDFTLSLNYDVSEDVLVYASLSTGFKAGGFSQRIGPGPGVPAPDFRKEEVTAYELGFKSTLLDNTLRLNGAAFFTDYTDLQITPIFEGIGPVTRNIGDAEIFGVEAEWTYVPNEAFEWSGGIGYLDDQLTSLTPEAAVNLDTLGNQILTLDTQLAKTPTWSINSAMSYRVPIKTDADVVFRGNWSFTSELFNDVLNSQVLRRPSLHLFGASVAYETGPWAASFTANNLTNEEYIIAGNDETAAAQFGYAQATFARPREWWFSVKRDF